MITRLRSLLSRLWRLRCCVPPPGPSGVTAAGGGGSGEVLLTWDPLPPSASVAFYRVYRANGNGTFWHVAVVLPSTIGDVMPGKVGIVDFPTFWPWPTGDDGAVTRCYVVTAVSTRGLEGPMSLEVCGTPTS